MANITANIAELVARLTIDDSGFVAKVKKNLAKLTSVSSAVQHAFDIDRARSDAQKAMGAKDQGPNMADGYDRVAKAVERLQDAFAMGLSEGGGFAGLLEQIVGILDHLTPLFATAGHWIGVFNSWMSSSCASSVAFILALKILAAALGVVIWMLSHVVWGAFVFALTGMGPLTLYWTAVTWLLAAALRAATGATGMLSGAMAILTAVGLPWFVAIAVVVAAAAAALYGLYRAWQWVNAESAAGTAASNARAATQQTEIERLKQITAAAKEAAKMKAELDKQVAETGQTEESKRLAALEAYREKLQDTWALSSEINAKLAEFRGKQQEGVDRKVGAELARLEREAAQASMTASQRAADNVRRDGGGDRLASRALDLVEKQEQGVKLAERRKQLSEETLRVDREAAQAGMTELAKRADDLKRLNATPERQNYLANKERETSVTNALAEAERAAARAGLTEWQQKVAEFREAGVEAERLAAIEIRLALADREREDGGKRLAALSAIRDLETQAATAGLSATERRLAIYRQIGLEQRDIERSARAQQAIDGAKLIADNLTPLEKYKREVESINNLYSVGALGANGDQVAQRALDKANKDLDSAVATHDARDRQTESPTALFRGTAEAALAENRARNPIDRMTELQRQQLAEAKATKKVADQQLAAIRANKPQPMQVAKL